MAEQPSSSLQAECELMYGHRQGLLMCKAEKGQAEKEVVQVIPELYCQLALSPRVFAVGPHALPPEGSKVKGQGAW